MKKYKNFIDDIISKKSDFCIATFIDRENIFLRLWLKHYSHLNLDFYFFIDQKCNGNIVDFFKKNDNGRMNLIDISSQENSYGVINGNTNFFLDQIQEKFLRNYKKMIYVDIDELLICEDFMGALINENRDYFITTGFEIVHNYKIESDYNESIKLCDQRKNGVFLAKGEKYSSYNKVSILSKKYKWKSIGKHAGDSSKDNLFYLVHLSRFDLLTMIKNSQNSNIFYKSFPSSHNFNNLEDAKYYLEQFFIPNITEIPSYISKNIHV